MIMIIIIIIIIGQRSKIRINMILLYIMTTLINSEGTFLTYTNEFIETILLQLNPSLIIIKCT